IKYPQFTKSDADVFHIADLRSNGVVQALMDCDEVYQLAADMGGAGYVFTGEHDFDIMTNSVQINLNVAQCSNYAGRVFFSSSACM
ncbi:NAD-dependent epimerase/dehydratase family protein, partial [Streptococcus pneumoniae]|uniref:NAD-dependent epimerase/dehydratase family protein n=1 Tax=Streptococcus pneumoniae TaxID=1313 RepID=UPI0012D76665